MKDKQYQCDKLRRAGNADAWAIGRRQSNGFHIRRVVWGLLMASAERAEGEEIRRAVVMVKGKAARPVRV